MKKNYMIPMTGINEISVSQVLCASGMPSNALQFANETPGETMTAD